MKNPFIKIIITYIELFILVLTMNMNFSKKDNYYGSSNKVNNSIFEECLVIPNSSQYRNNNYSSDEKSPNSNENELFIFNTLMHVSLPDYSVMILTASLTAPSIPDYMLSTDQKSPPYYFL